MNSNNFNLQDLIIKDSIFTIGSVFSVKGTDVVVKVNSEKNLSHLFFNGNLIKNAAVGTSNYVKIIKGFTEIICKIEGEYLQEDKYENSKYHNEKQKIHRFLNVIVFGFYDNDGKFQHGIKEMPLIGSKCKLLSRDEFEKLHQLTDKDNLSVSIGKLIDEETYNISLSVKKLFAGHIGIFGNTGSGKSNTLAKIFAELFHHNLLNDNFKKKSRFIFIDFNGEYSNTDSILTKNKKVYQLTAEENNTDKYPIERIEIEKLEILSILLDATEKTQQPFLKRAIEEDWLNKYNEGCSKEVECINEILRTILTSKNNKFNLLFLKNFVQHFEQLGFEILDFLKNIDDIKYNVAYASFYIEEKVEGKVEKKYFESNEPSFIGKEGYFYVSGPGELDALTKTHFKILSRYYYEMLKEYINQEHIGPLIGRVKKRFDILNKIFDVKENYEEINENIEVINFKNVNLEIKKIIPLLICKHYYDKQKKCYSDNEQTLHIIIDEAHNILSDISNRESESWKDYRLETFEEIIKEGRKFGAFLTIASQRPYDISPTIISQIHNYFIHKLVNEKDLRAINKVVSYLDKLSFNSISNLSTGCCFIAGQMTQFPLSIKVDLLSKNLQPQSETIDLNKLWLNSK